MRSCKIIFACLLSLLSLPISVWQSREAVLAKATEDMFGKWGTYIKGEVQVQPCFLAVCDLDFAATSFDKSQPKPKQGVK